MGVNVAVFEYILQHGFERLWDTCTIFRDDVNELGQPWLRRRLLPADGALGLTLHWLTSTASNSALEQIFAIVPAVLSHYLSFSLQILVYVLCNLPEGQIIWPSPDEMDAFSAMIQQRHPAIWGAFGFVDGLNLPVETSSDLQLEESTYNGWLHSHRIGNIFVFAPNGCIIACKLNAPGSWHDFCVARHVYTKLIENTPEGHFLIADTAFLTRSPALDGKIHTPLKQGSRLPADRDERAEAIEYSNRLTQARQAAEWGMRALQGAFCRL
ncbi:DDE family endonuclease [Rhizoctonia solani AG-3 Rhs1AP]|uniref:DDE family endonuclease n=2 Tax=Rhizoctonia solani AG-3 TaxID=1086053 RepID=A0A074S491_9AGAM|nr:DDE family endonuclease [Rhizoctonia solani AG-3 Rhs1AP]KEP44937.1 DDE family endonuclease [Rhizoctonia solani 123E]